jgi:hypothetical protein
MIKKGLMIENSDGTFTYSQKYFDQETRRNQHFQNSLPNNLFTK